MDFTDPLSNPAILIFSAVLPLLISLVKQQGWSRSVNSFIALLCYFIVGVAAIFLSGEELSVENAVPIITVVTVVGTAAYNLFWSNFGASTQDGPSLESRLTDVTSFVK